jgi:hypothetical protein
MADKACSQQSAGVVLLHQRTSVTEWTSEHALIAECAADVHPGQLEASMVMAAADEVHPAGQLQASTVTDAGKSPCHNRLSAACYPCLHAFQNGRISENPFRLLSVRPEPKKKQSLKMNY